MTWLRWLPAASLGGLIFAVSHQQQLPRATAGAPDWVLHGLAYGALALAIRYGLAGGERPRTPLGRDLLAVVAASLYGVTDELHQSFVPGRDPAILDWVADTVGAALALAAARVGAFAGFWGLWENSRS